MFVMQLVFCVTNGRDLQVIIYTGLVYFTSQHLEHVFSVSCMHYVNQSNLHKMTYILSSMNCVHYIFCSLSGLLSLLP